MSMSSTKSSLASSEKLSVMSVVDLFKPFNELRSGTLCKNGVNLYSRSRRVSSNQPAATSRSIAQIYLFFSSTGSLVDQIALLILAKKIRTKQVEPSLLIQSIMVRIFHARFRAESSLSCEYKNLSRSFVFDRIQLIKMKVK